MGPYCCLISSVNSMAFNFHATSVYRSSEMSCQSAVLTVSREGEGRVVTTTSDVAIFSESNQLAYPATCPGYDE